MELQLTDSEAQQFIKIAKEIIKKYKINVSTHPRGTILIRSQLIDRDFILYYFYNEGDGRTHYKAYPLPFDSIKNTDDFFMAFENILEYTNTQENGMISMIPTLPTN